MPITNPLPAITYPSKDTLSKTAKAISRFGLHPFSEGLKAAGAVYAISEATDQGFDAGLKGPGWYIPMGIALTGSAALALISHIKKDQIDILAKIEKGVQLGIEIVEESALFILFVHDALTDENKKIEGPILFTELALAGLGASIVILRSLYYRHEYNQATLPFTATVKTGLLPQEHLKSKTKQFLEVGLLEPLMVAGLTWGIATLVADTEAISEEMAVFLAMATTPLPIIKRAIEAATGKQSENLNKALAHIGETLLGAVFPIALLMYTYVVATNNYEVPNAYFAFTIALGLVVGGQRSYNLLETKPYKLPTADTSNLQSQVQVVDGGYQDDYDDVADDNNRRMPGLV